jgi:hypothetical protein
LPPPPRPRRKRSQTRFSFSSLYYRKLPLIIMIAHAVTSNNISSLLQNIDQVLFMRNRVTVPSVSFVLSKYQFTKGQRDRLVRDFLLDCKTGPSWLYWVLDAEAGTFRRDSFAGSSAASAPLDTLGEYRKKAQYYVGLFCEHSDKAMAVFEFLLKKIPLQSLNASDLSMSLGGRTDRRVSLIDFLHDVTTFGAVPSGDVVALHRHLLSYADIPSCFYLNPSLKKTKHEKKEPSPPTPVPTTTAVKTHSSSVRAAATVTDDSRSETRIVRKRRDDDNDDRVSSAKRRRVIRY